MQRTQDVPTLQQWCKCAGRHAVLLDVTGCCSYKTLPTMVPRQGRRGTRGESRGRVCKRTRRRAGQVGEPLRDAIAQDDEAQVRQRVLVEELADEALRAAHARRLGAPAAAELAPRPAPPQRAPPSMPHEQRRHGLSRELTAAPTPDRMLPQMH